MKHLFFLLAILFFTTVQAQQNADYQAYIEKYSPLAVSEQMRSGVPASIKLAQGLLESGAGKGNLTQRSNNHFGIKCKATWTGEKVYHDDDLRGECFRSYNSAEESYRDHSDFLRQNGRYASLFQLDPTDYKGWAEGLKKAGYATNPRYIQMLLKVIEENNLNVYTLIALNKASGNGADIAVVVPAAQAPADQKPVYVERPATNPAPAVAVVQQTPENNSLQHTTADTRISLYPTVPFFINHTKVVWANAGTSVLALASKYNVSMYEMLSFNDMEKTDILKQDQLVYLERKQKAAQHDVYETKPGETLWSISQTEGIRLQLLKEWNKTAADKPLAPGTKVLLKSPLTGRK